MRGSADERSKPVASAPSTEGFSLVEVLISLVLIALMSALMVASIRQFRTVKTLEAQVVEQAEVDAATDFMAAEIRAALRLPLLHAGGQSSRSFVGSANTVQFVAVSRTGFTSKKLVEIEYSIETANARSSVGRRVWKHEASDATREPLISDVILSGVRSLSLRYLKPGPDGTSVNEEVWNSLNELPAAIQIHIEKAYAERVLSSNRTVALID